MIHYAPLASGRHIPAPVAFLLLLIPVLFVALFPALSCLLLFRLVKHFGPLAILLLPLIWVSIDWLRYVVTGQAWNAIGYSQAFHPVMIQTARLGGVYAVTFFVIMLNAAVALLVFEGISRRSVLLGLLLLGAALSILVWSQSVSRTFVDELTFKPEDETLVIGLQPNVPMSEVGDNGFRQLLDRHLEESQRALSISPTMPIDHRLVIWPESPMNFSYARDQHLREVVGNFARASRTSVLLNSLESGPNGAEYNSAILVNEQGQKIAQYDKIRLMPFGEYVPLPRWLPGASSVRGIVGEFTPGSSYTLMPLGAIRAGVFICIEAAHPGVAREFANEGADLLINISNDGYLGPTPVMRQHLANAVFRAVENDRPLVRVTNSGITAHIDANGAVSDETRGFEQAVRTWSITRDNRGTTFYTRHGDLFVYGCGLISLAFIVASFTRRRWEQ
jgi:apolipoprotein N-acyltransferase